MDERNVYRGFVENGLVRLNDGARLSDGTEVTIRPVGRKRATSKKRSARTKRRRSETLGEALKEFKGRGEGLPTDAARNLDHYLYGHRKR